VGAWAFRRVHVHACLRVTLFVEHVTRMRNIFTLFVASLAPPYFSTLSHKDTIFGKKVTEHKMCVLIFSTTFVSNISHSNKKSATYCPKFENVIMQSTPY
jgi:hypothetical protein